MAAITEKQVNLTSNELEVIQKIVADSTLNVTKAMMLALIEGHTNQLNFKNLAERHINAKLDEELSETDDKVLMLYRKLFAASDELIQKVSSQVLGRMLEQIKVDTKDPEASNQFLGSFVLVETKKMHERLQTEAPNALECKEIWV